MDRERTRPAGDRDEMRAVADPLGRAMLAHHRDEPGELVYRDGAATRDGNVEAFYFSSSESWDRPTIEALERLADREPILDVGCGAGNHLLWWADRDVRAVGVDASPNAVLTARERFEVRRTSRRSCVERRSTHRSSGLRGGGAASNGTAKPSPSPREDGEAAERGLEDVLVGDMFALPVPTDAFGAVHAVGTQLGLGGSLAGIRELLREFARVTADEATAVVDNYDPTRLDDCFGYRSDPREGIAHRCFHLEFEGEDADGERYREIGRTLHFLLCSPARLREATAETPWRVRDVLRADGDAHYRAVLGKPSLESE
ncbi:class I SAM-dependent methyltransferase [Haloterrigena sp. SYSU A558-1]|uniref:Class I SAM-dependent methyltransferase n=1 Tax=Haloterrigena gelatinilytica TaxID=2741724 RepID=A0A8J8KDY3_9EURY|nr:class I SAM-dependent methyltransferase [Haloterrigena gelatinilytica]NUB90056.1 class I SAM-dependent methyltransferase [Haloterrigena gelatinilytica]NUC74118.1 class I SAM-dependent methyltransferase [Haloterrigena gelatinilytica]